MACRLSRNDIYSKSEDDQLSCGTSRRTAVRTVMSWVIAITLTLPLAQRILDGACSATYLICVVTRGSRLGRMLRPRLRKTTKSSDAEHPTERHANSEKQPSATQTGYAQHHSMIPGAYCQYRA